MLKNRIRSITVQWAFALVLILSAVSPVAAQHGIGPSPIELPGPKGDANLDGVVTKADINALIRHMLGIEELSPQGMRNADVDCDRRFSMGDVRLINLYIRGFISSFPC